MIEKQQTPAPYCARLKKAVQETIGYGLTYIAKCMSERLDEITKQVTQANCPRGWEGGAPFRSPIQ